MTHFTDLGLAEPIVRAVSAEGYATPTPIQSQVIPMFLKERDIVGVAQTGTGKTASFALPLLSQLAAANDRRRPKRCRALILTPTRELAAQITDNIRNYARYTQMRVALVVGGARPGPQVKAMKSGVDILVATPGRLLDHMTAKAISLDQTSAIVLDEADQMLDMGFIPAIRRIMTALPNERQTILMSATMPTQIRRLAQDFLKNPARISVAAQARPIELIRQSVRHMPRPQKREALTNILSGKDVTRAVVFTRTKRGAEHVARHLHKAGLSCAAIHGDKNQNQRQRSLNAFRAGKIAILVATDIAARGIDVDSISHVINYELPNVPETYVHRIGRTARAGQSGVAISLCEPGERDLLRAIEKLIGEPIESNGAQPQPPSGDKAHTRNKPGKKAGARKNGKQGDKPFRRNKTASTEPGQPKRRRKKKHAKPDAGANASGKRVTGNDALGKNNISAKNSASAGLSRTFGKIAAAQANAAL